MYSFTLQKEENRVKLLHVSPETLVELFRQDGSVRLKFTGMPWDAKIVGVSDQPRFGNGLFSFKVWSSEFPSILDGDAIPDMTIDVARVDEPQRGRQYI